MENFALILLRDTVINIRVNVSIFTIGLHAVLFMVTMSYAKMSNLPRVMKNASNSVAAGKRHRTYKYSILSMSLHT